jgi:hypothetical protein
MELQESDPTACYNDTIYLTIISEDFKKVAIQTLGWEVTLCNILQFCIMIHLEVYTKVFKFIFIINGKTTTVQLYDIHIHFFWLHDSN